MVKLSMGYARVIIIIAGVCAVAVPGMANDFAREGLRGDTVCFPVKYVTQTIKRLSHIRPERSDVVKIEMAPQFKVYDGGDLPHRYYLQNGNQEIDFDVRPNGEVPDFIDKVIYAPKDADICIEDPARAGLPKDDESLYFEMGLTPFFKDVSGFHTVADLRKGAKDGRYKYKKIVPRVLRMFVPAIDHLHVKYTHMETVPQVFARVDGQDVPVTLMPYNEGHVLNCAELEHLGADGLVIKGGSYKLSPVPSIKAMKRFGIGKPRGPQKDI